MNDQDTRVGSGHLFVSYAAEDEATADRLVVQLEAAGASCWYMKRDVPAGSNYTVVLDAAIKSARGLVLLYSAATADSKGCSRELELADHAELPVVPVRIDDAPLSERFTYLLATVQWLDARTSDAAGAALRALGLNSVEPVHDTAAAAPARRLRSRPAVPSLTGRDWEREQIDKLLRDVRASSTGALVIIQGASGVGKSTLAQYAISRAAEEGFDTASTICEPFHEGMSFFPIRELMRQLTRAESPSVDIAEIYGPRSIEASMATLTNTEGIDATARRDALLASFANLTLGRTRRQVPVPLLLLIEDMERADPGTVDSLLCLFARLSEGPVVVVGTYRTDEAGLRTSGRHLSPLLRAVTRSQDRTLVLTLGPIGRLDIRSLAANILGGRVSLPTRFVEHLWRETEGNPLYCREIIRALQDSRADGGARLECIDDVWRLSGDLIGWQTPPSVEDAIRSRLELIEPGPRSELERASVIGKRFAFDLMVQIAEADETDLLDLLEECVNLSLIQEVSGPDDSFEFTHGKIRDVLYESMTRIKRRRLHSFVADALIRMRGVLRGDWEALIGEHLYRSARNREAVPYLVEAAADLMKLSAAPEAARLLEQAISAHTQSKGDPAEITPARLKLVEALVSANEYRKALELAIQAARDPDVDRTTQGWFSDLCGDIHRALGNRANALVEYRLAEAIAVAEHAGELELEVCADLAELYERASEEEAGINDVESAEFAKLGESYLDRQIALAPEFGDAVAQARALRNEAKQLRKRGDIANALVTYEKGLSFADPRVATHTLLISYAKTLRFAGRFDEAADVVTRVQQWSVQASARRSLAIALHYRAMLAMEATGPTEDAKADLETALEIHQEIRYDRGMWEVETLLGEWHAMHGAWELAFDWFAKVLQSESGQTDDEVITAVCRQLEAITEFGRADRLRQHWSAR
jgi:predicted ATPase